MAAKAVIRTPELLREIASHIYERESLSQLCLVSHAFKVAFTPQLYRCLRWDEHNIGFLADPAKRRSLLDNNKLVHTRIFMIVESGVDSLLAAWRREHPRKESCWRHSDHWYFTGLETIWTQLSDAIVEVCQHTVMLQTFAFQDVPLTWDSVAVLSSIPTLRNISIEFHRDNEQILNVDTDATEQALQGLSHPAARFKFAGLRKLSLLGLWGYRKDIRAWRDRILQVMLDSPDLEYLALSLSDDVRLDSDDETDDESSLDMLCNKVMFESLCRMYTEATGRSLHFESTLIETGIVRHAWSLTGWARRGSISPVYIWNEAGGSFSQGLEPFPMSDIGAEWCG